MIIAFRHRAERPGRPQSVRRFRTKARECAWTRLLHGCSRSIPRSRLQAWLKDGVLTVEGASPEAKRAVAGGERGGAVAAGGSERGLAAGAEPAAHDRA